MTQNDLVLTEEDRNRLRDIYLSGFLSGASSAIITAGMSVEAATAISKMMAKAIEKDEGATGDMWATIMACMEDRDLPDGPIREVENVFLPE
jgi:hypothetical protein